MKVSYIKHSGFLVEWEDVSLIFDFSGGEVPPLDPAKKLFIFSSHSHSDHFSEEIFSISSRVKEHVYILSDDIKAAPPEEDSGTLIRISAGQRRILKTPGGPLSVFALKSTDLGVAFVVTYRGQTVYHAGDLHWWAWPDDLPEDAKAMEKAFFAECRKLKGLRLDAAFLPLDPRLQENYWKGFDAIMRTAEVRCAFPMHMWERYEYILAMKENPVSVPYRDRIMDIRKPGEKFTV